MIFKANQSRRCHGLPAPSRLIVRTAKKITKKLAGNKFITYICSMRKELGKWLMDIAKYITTAVVLTSIFGDLQEEWIIYMGGSFAVVVTLLAGLWLVRDEKEGE